jgi:membrane protease subunit (stomatin/prohibitin family)
LALLDRVKFDGPPDVLVWKWPHESLTLGAQVVVNESQQALFYKSGQALDLFEPGTHTLSTGNLPFLQKIVNLPFGGKTPFAAEIYFISKAVALGQDWGTKTPVLIMDPKYNVSIPLRAYGSFALRVVNAREFVTQIAGASGGGTRGSIAADVISKAFVAQVAPIAPHAENVNLVGTSANDTARNLLESLIIACVQQAVGAHLSEQSISVLDLPSQILMLAKRTEVLLKEHYQTFGVELINFVLESINFDPNDESVRHLRSMLNEAARLSLVGDAFRKNQDFYRAERQFDVLEGAAEGGGGASALMGAAMGVGMGFGVAGPAGALAKESMATPSVACAKCGGLTAPGTKFCPTCGEQLTVLSKACPSCSAPNLDKAKFCSNCGTPITQTRCGKCRAELVPGSKFCPQCGEKL